MISVIVPTMWKPKHMLRMLPMLDAHPLIGEIILIDNKKEDVNNDLLKSLTKLNYFPQEENIFVNPAWNLGVSVAEYDKLFILNDDCLINLTTLNQIYDDITPEIGMLGYSKLSYCSYDIEAFDTLCNSGFGIDYSKEIVDPRDYPSNSGMPHIYYGSAFYIHKQSYHHIPEVFKIHYGDLYIYLKNLKNGIHNYTIEDGFVMTMVSGTVSTAASSILNEEADLLKEVFAEHGLKDIKYQIPT